MWSVSITKGVWLWTCSPHFLPTAPLWDMADLASKLWPVRGERSRKKDKDSHRARTKICYAMLIPSELFLGFSQFWFSCKVLEKNDKLWIKQQLHFHITYSLTHWPQKWKSMGSQQTAFGHFLAAFRKKRRKRSLDHSAFIRNPRTIGQHYIPQKGHQ